MSVANVAPKTDTPESHADAAAAEWWRGAVIYQVYPRSFLDTSGDGVGDLKGVLKGLDHIASLGVDAVWISPFFKSPMRDFGYDVSDYRDVDPVFGTLKDFDDIVEKAHRLGLKVIIDQVYSHTSDEHEWFEESRQSRDNPKADWYVWADPKEDGAPPNNWQSVFNGGAWEWDSRRQQYYLHNFLASQPDLNLHNLEVQDAILDVAKFWLDRGVDGFRLDAINFAMHDPQLRDNPPAPITGAKPKRPFEFQLHKYNQSHSDIPKFLERIRALTDRYDCVFTVAEVGGPDPINEMKSFTEDDLRLNSAYNFSFLYAEELTKDIAQRAAQEWRAAPGEGWPSWAFSNHDAPRAVSRWAPEDRQEQAAKLHAMVLMSLRGNVFVFQGEELGLPQADVPFEALQDPEAIVNWPYTLGRDGARTPIPWKQGEKNAGFSAGAPWLPLDPKHGALAIDAQNMNPQSTLNFMRRLIEIRKQTPALRLGELSFLDSPENLLALRRSHQGENVYCVFNLSEQAVAWRPKSETPLRRIADAGVDAPNDAIPETLPSLSGYIAVKKA